MSTTELMDLIKQLPDDKKKEVEDLVYALTSGSNIESTPDRVNIGDNKKRMHFGDLKGFVTYIADDFDEPLEDFNDYM